MKIAGWGILLVCTMLTGCRTTAVALPTAVPLSQEAPLNPPVFPATATLEPTSTSQPDLTPTPAAETGTAASVPPLADQQKPPTPLPATASAIATLDALQSPCGEDLRIGDWPGIESLSPNGRWAAYQCFSISAGSYVKVLSLDGRIAYTALFAETYAAVPTNGEQDPILTLPTHWSPDGRLLFLRTVFPDLRAPGAAFTDGYGLYRLNLLGGRLEQILPPVSGLEGYALEISPDGRSLAYTLPGEEAAFHVRDLETGAEETYTLDPRYPTIGLFAWSDDGSRLAFSAAGAGFGDPGYTGGFSVLLVDRRSHLVTLLLSDPPARYRVTGWNTSSEIVITALDPGSPVLLYNVDTQSLSNP